MPAPACSADEFARIWHRHQGHAASVAAELGMVERPVFARRARLEAMGYELPCGQEPPSNITKRSAYPTRQDVTLQDGVAVVFSDRHYWPGDGITPAEAALLTLLPRLNPDLLICNGDVYDGAAQSRHAPLGWERKPDVRDELGAVQGGMARIAAAAPQARKLRTVGNHDRRFDYRLAQVAPDYRGIAGTRLSDHLPDWPESWAAHVNAGGPGHTVIKHKLRQGVTAGRNNGLAAGTHIVTAHTHALDVTCLEDYRGRRYSVQTGMLGDPNSPAFEYGEDAPIKGRPGFVVLTWQSGLLLPPEVCEVDDAGVAWFRGAPVALRFRVRAGSREA